MGSEEFIRLQFEEYLLALLSSVKYHIYLQRHPHCSPLPSIEGDPSSDFNSDWIHAWQQTSSFALFTSHTSAHLFDIVEPRHPTAGNLSLEDIQRRLTLQIQTLHLDDRLATSKEVLNKHLATGQKKVSTAFTNLWADIEAMREAQRKRAEAINNGAFPPASEAGSSDNPSSSFAAAATRRGAPDLSAAQASVSAASHKAGAYISSWGAWAAERRRGWVKGGATNVSAGSGASTPTGGTVATTTIEKAKDKGWDINRGVGKSPIKRGVSHREEKGGDGIGRLDA